jgi:hypothetical protein
VRPRSPEAGERLWVLFDGEHVGMLEDAPHLARRRGHPRRTSDRPAGSDLRSRPAPLASCHQQCTRDSESAEPERAKLDGAALTALDGRRPDSRTSRHHRPPRPMRYLQVSTLAVNSPHRWARLGDAASARDPPARPRAPETVTGSVRATLFVLAATPCASRSDARRQVWCRASRTWSMMVRAGPVTTWAVALVPA